MYGVGGTFSPEDVTPDSYNYLCIGLGADTKISSNCHSDASGSTIWSLQPVFTNKYNIFQ